MRIVCGIGEEDITVVGSVAHVEAVSCYKCWHVLRATEVTCHMIDSNLSCAEMQKEMNIEHKILSTNES